MISECHLRKQAQAQADPLDSDDAMFSESFNALPQNMLTFLRHQYRGALQPKASVKSSRILEGIYTSALIFNKKQNNSWVVEAIVRLREPN